MSVELLQLLSTVFFVLSVVLFLIAVALFFSFDIVSVIGDITGSTARKAIEDIRKGNEISGNKAYKPSPVNKARGKITDKISPSGQVLQRKGNLGVATGTAKLNTAEIAPSSSSSSGSKSSEETTVLENVSNETTVLNQMVNETTVLSQMSNETTVLSQVAAETTVLGMYEETPVAINNFTAPVNQHEFVLDIEMNFAGSDVLIE